MSKYIKAMYYSKLCKDIWWENDTNIVVEEYLRFYQTSPIEFRNWILQKINE